MLCWTDMAQKECSTITEMEGMSNCQKTMSSDWN